MTHAVRVDPERHEIELLLQMAPELKEAEVLEVGCGDGRLTGLYAPLAARVLAIDPAAAGIEDARANHDPARSSVEFRCAAISDLAPPSPRFDVAILAWSL